MGVVLGSNVFNLAAMIGTSAVLAGAVHLTRRSLLIEGAVALLAAAIAGRLDPRRDLRPASPIAAFALVAVPYVVLLGRGRLHTEHRGGEGARPHHRRDPGSPSRTCGRWSA